MAVKDIKFKVPRNVKVETHLLVKYEKSIGELEITKRLSQIEKEQFKPMPIDAHGKEIDLYVNEFCQFEEEKFKKKIRLCYEAAFQEAEDRNLMDFIIDFDEIDLWEFGYCIEKTIEKCWNIVADIFEKYEELELNTSFLRAGLETYLEPPSDNKIFSISDSDEKVDKYYEQLSDCVDEFEYSEAVRFIKSCADWFKMLHEEVIPLLESENLSKLHKRKVYNICEKSTDFEKIISQIYEPMESAYLKSLKTQIQKHRDNVLNSNKVAARKSGIVRAKNAEERWKTKAREILKANFLDSELLKLKRKKKILRKPILDNWKNQIGDNYIGDRQIDNFIDQICQEISNNIQLKK